MQTLDDVILSLTNHKPQTEAVEKVERVRNAAKTMATTIFRECPPSRERSLAITALEEQVMWAVKSIVLLRQPRLGDS